MELVHFIISIECLRLFSIFFFMLCHSIRNDGTILIFRIGGTNQGINVLKSRKLNLYVNQTGRAINQKPRYSLGKIKYPMKLRAQGLNAKHRKIVIGCNKSANVDLHYIVKLAPRAYRTFSYLNRSFAILHYCTLD